MSHSLFQLFFQCIDPVLFVIALGLFFPIAVLFLECTVALLPLLPNRPTFEKQRPSVAVLIPAHNEASVIADTLSALLPQLTALDQLVVIADNCTDETAEMARQAGATVIERQDLEHRGKGYALDFGLQFLASQPPDVLVIVDADCICQPHALDQLARSAATGHPVQAIYLMERPGNPSPKDSVSALAFTVKNLVRPFGLYKLSLPTLLTGTGMAFPWAVIQEVSLASGNIVEDMQLAVDLAIAGHPTTLCPNAKVIGRLPQQQQAAKSQRTRWEHGHLQTLLIQTPKLFKAAILQKRFDLFALGLDIVVPPLSLLVMLWGVTLAISVLSAILGGWSTPALFLVFQGFLLLVAIVSAWAKFARQEIPASTLLAVPFYILWKIPLYLAFLIQRQTQWIRTERDPVSKA